ncbi:DNA repair and recombination protein RAD54B [Entamoeba marina]
MKRHNPPSKFVPLLVVPKQSNIDNSATSPLESCKIDSVDNTISLFKILWTKDLKKKQKLFNDGFLIVKSNNIAFLRSCEDKELAKIPRADTVFSLTFTTGDTFIYANKLIEIDCEVPISEYISGKLFMRETPQKIVKRQHPTPMRKMFHEQPKTQQQKISLYDITNPFSYVLDSEHQPIVLIDPYIGKHLRPHQVEGVKFMYNCITRGGSCGCILADEMGLGKTLQTITLIWVMYKQHKTKKIVVVCPQSLIGNWEKEFKKWLGVERMEVKTGSGDSLMKQKVEDFVKSYVPVLIIGYEQVRSHVEELKKTDIGLIVCDEGHRIKNSSSKTTSALRALGSPHHIILSGTPVQNGLDDFYSLLEFCTPGFMESLKLFRTVFAYPIQKAQNGDATIEELETGRERAKELTSKLKDYVLRRTSRVNEQYLPDKTEIVVFVKPSEIQIKLYEFMLRQLKKEKIEMCAALQYIQHFTKLCNHPMLIANQLLEKSPTIEKSLKEALESYEIHENFSNKFSVTIHFLQSILSCSQEKVVIVSNYTKTLDIFETFFKLHQNLNVKHLRLDGQTSQQQRSNIVDRINDPDSEINVLLLSSKAGGVGLNLIGCSRLFLKAIIYRMLCTGTIEEKIYQRQLQKNQVSESVVEEHLEAGRSLSQEQLRKVFDLNLDTLSDTHDALNCDCFLSHQEPEGGIKHLVIGMTEEINAVDPLIMKIGDVVKNISMLFVSEFHAKKED